MIVFVVPPTVPSHHPSSGGRRRPQGDESKPDRPGRGSRLPSKRRTRAVHPLPLAADTIGMKVCERNAQVLEQMAERRELLAAERRRQTGNAGAETTRAHIHRETARLLGRTSAPPATMWFGPPPAHYAPPMLMPTRRDEQHSDEVLDITRMSADLAVRVAGARARVRVDRGSDAEGAHSAVGEDARAAEGPARSLRHAERGPRRHPRSQSTRRWTASIVRLLIAGGAQIRQTRNRSMASCAQYERPETPCADRHRAASARGPP